MIPSSGEQVIQSLDPGIITEMKVKAGDVVEKGQVLLKLDDTRSSAVLRESEAKVNNLEAMVVACALSSRYAVELPKGISNELIQREQAFMRLAAAPVVEAVRDLANSKSFA